MATRKVLISCARSGQRVCCQHSCCQRSSALVAARAYFDHADAVEKTAKQAVELATDFAARGFTEQALQLLQNSPSKDILEPLVVALELHAGHSVSAPREILEVADDILQDIEDRCAALAEQSS